MRRRMLLALTLVFGVFVFSGSANATVDLLDYQAAVDEMQAVDPTLDPPPNDGQHDFVVGGFQSFGTNWGVSAHSGPAGEEPFGHVSQTVPHEPTDIKHGRWRVTCVNVAGQLAAVGVVPTRAASNDADDELLLLFRDAGPGGGTPLQPDGFRAVVADDQRCHEPFFVIVAAVSDPIERGNILIRDVQP